MPVALDASAAGKAGAAPPPTILIVDDSDTVRQSLAMRLGAREFAAVTARSGDEALALLDRREVDLVLLDLRMPGMSGLDVLQQLRRRYSAADLPVIMLTVSDDTPDILQAYESGANDYVVKPGELSVLVARIRTQLSMRDAHRALRDAHSDMEQSLVHQIETLSEASASYAANGATARPYGADRRYRLLFDENPSMLFTLTSDAQIVSVNRAGAAELGYRGPDLPGTSMLNLYHPEDRGIAERHLVTVAEQPERLHRWELRKLTRGGDARWYRETVRVIGAPDGNAEILMVCEDIAETHRLSERLSYQERFDALTGLLNRRSFTEELERALADVHRDHSDQALLFLDLDQFKVVNDTCGHAAGDEMLVRLAELFRRTLHRRDTIARMGDDEFAVLLSDHTPAAAIANANALREAIQAHHVRWAGATLSVTASVAIVPITESQRDPGVLLAMADAACHAAKDAGRNRVHLYNDADLRVAARFGDMQWANRIKSALAHNRFSLAVQRIAPVQAAEHDGEHIELLLRMHDEDGQEFLPGRFLPAAERYNLASQLDLWVLRYALNWLNEHSDVLARLHVCAINLSGQSLNDEGVLEWLLGALQGNEVLAGKLCFEITETAAINDFGNALRFITELKELGCRFALDDFGSGMASFAYLKLLPVDYLKIDGVFVKDIATDTTDRALVRSMNELGHVLGKQTIAEFVEDQATYAALREIGVDYAQGYWLGRPMPLHAYR